MADKIILTYRYRVKDKHTAELNRMARVVNFVWNFCNDTQKHALKWNKKWPTHFDLAKLTSGSSCELRLSAQSIEAVCKQYDRSRRQHKLPFLRYRGKRSMGWVPFRGISIKANKCNFSYYRQVYSVWYTRPIPVDAKILDGGSFSQDARGRWYLNIIFEIPTKQRTTKEAVGIDLGLKSLATLSTGEEIDAPRYFRKSEKKLAKAQRAGKKKLAKNIHAKIKNQRKDFLHKISTDITKRFGTIAVGDVNAKKLAKTKMAKSVYDASWTDFRTMLHYKTIAQGGEYIEVKESYTSVTCSDCGAVSGPKGRKGLRVREWGCFECGSVHNRDHNSSKLIFRLGQQSLNAGAAFSSGVGKAPVHPITNPRLVLAHP